MEPLSMDCSKSKLCLVLLVFVLAGCGQRYSDSQATAPVQKKFATADLAKLRWIEGTWRGSGVDQPPFYERYRFEGDSILAVDSFPDEKLEKVEDTTRFELKDGQFGNGGDGARWAASVIDDQGVTFEPVAKAKNSFRWERESADTWKAILKWQAVEDKQARERIYKMERIPGK
jgi:hypothetical protein